MFTWKKKSSLNKIMNKCLETLKMHNYSWMPSLALHEPPKETNQGFKCLKIFNVKTVHN